MDRCCGETGGEYMLKKFSLRNYKNFKEEIAIDFQNIAGYQFNNDCITDGIISKILIYGRNATGKTNLGKALMDIENIVYGGWARMEEGLLFNADSTEEVTAFSYTFQFGGHEVLYRYERCEDLELKEEELIIDQQKVYQCNFSQEHYNFDNLQSIGAENINIERYMQAMTGRSEETEDGVEYQMPFLRWLINNAALQSDSVLLRLAEFVRGMDRMTVRQGIMRRPNRMNMGFFHLLEDLSAMADFEEFLNVMGIKCRLALRKLPDGQRELYFVHDKLVPFYENASSGTLALVELYRKFIVRKRNATFIYLDEFDAFYHYEMADHIIRYFKKKYPKCQIIMTTHNTNLMTNRLMRPDCLFILSTEGKLTALCNATQRELREGHNLEKMYISGEFEKYE